MQSVSETRLMHAVLTL